MSPIDEAKSRLLIPELWNLLGLPGQPGKANPFREDGNLSFSVYDGGKRFKDHGTGEGGDAIDFLAKAKGLSNAAAIREFLRIAGVESGTPNKGEPPRVDLLNPEQRTKLAKWRGYSDGFVDWLCDAKIVGLIDGEKIAIAVLDEDGSLIGAHFKLKRSGGWRYRPTGMKTHPLVFAQTRNATRIFASKIFVFESQWDGFAAMDKFGWHMAPPNDCAVFITRGAENGRLVSGAFASNSSVYAFVQNDQPDDAGRIAAERWLAAIVKHAGCKVFRVGTPAPHKDLNDWTRSCATREDIERAVANAEILSADSPVLSSSTEPAADVRGSLVKILLDRSLTFSEQRKAVADAVVTFLAKRGRFFHHADLKDFASAMWFDGECKRLLRVQSDEFQAWLSNITAVNGSDALFKFITAAVRATALAGEKTTGIIPEAFWASRGSAIYMSSGDGAVVKVTSESVELCDNGVDNVLFASGRTLAPWKLVDPADPFERCSVFSKLHSEAGHAQLLLKLWIYSIPTIPRSKPPLCAVGEVGSGKTRLAKAIAELFGLPFIALKVDEKKEADFWPALDRGGIICLDNVDSRCRWLADAISNASTDGTALQRKLYTNADTILLRSRAWIIVTTSNPTWASDAGAADRVVLLNMARPEDSETVDLKLTEELLAARDAGLSHLARTLQAALADDSPTPPGLNGRHPDFGAFAVRIGRALGRGEQAVQALKIAEQDKASFAVENDQTAAAVVAAVRSRGSFHGTAAVLLEQILEIDADLADKLNAKRLGRRLCLLWPHLARLLKTAKREINGNGVTVFHFESGLPPTRQPESHTSRSQPAPVTVFGEGSI